MTVRDIVNRDVVNLENCDQEPIHIPGSIQEHGCLLAADQASLRIRFVSKNVEAFIGLPYEQLLDKPLQTVFDTPIEAQLAAILQLPEKQHLFNIQHQDRQLAVLGHLHGGNLILEIEKAIQNVPNTDFIELSKSFVSYIDNTLTINDLGDKVAHTIKRITGYDRVMIYRFDENYNGEVISESKEEHLESFLGLHYPHTDIPAQARELYIKNQLRIIVDMDYVPVPIFTDNMQAAPSSLDLGLSVLRSVSPMHVAYLKNMGVAATLTVSLLHKNKLWGLIACHHYTPKYLPYDVRLSVKLLGYFITSQIDTRLLNEELEVARQVNQAADELLLLELPYTLESFNKIIAHPNLLKLCNAQGVCLLVKDNIYTHGITPSPTLILQLQAAIKKKSKAAESFYTNALAAYFPTLPLKPQQVFGVNYFILSEDQTNCIMWFRHETIWEVKWAGDPQKAIEKNKDGLSPRKSFELWKETVKDQSKPWLVSELRATEKVVKHLERHIFTVFLKEEEEKQRTLAIALRQSNDELENINWISTHDLQEPLRKIRIMSSMLFSNANHEVPEQIKTRLKKIDEASERLRNLIEDISKYSKMNHEEGILEKVNLEEMLHLQQQDLAEELHGAAFMLQDIPVIRGNKFLLRQLFANLIHNSIKFTPAERTLHIKISLVKDKKSLPEDVQRYLPKYHVIEFADNGIGFDNAYREKIFLPFKRLHSKDAYRGSGIGLALCRRIMTKHGGFIFAEGQEGVGAKLYLVFPIPV